MLMGHHIHSALVSCVYISFHHCLQVLKSSEVIMATLTSSSDDGPLRSLGEGHFDVVVIDECSQVNPNVYSHGFQFCLQVFYSIKTKFANSHFGFVIRYVVFRLCPD